MEGLPRLGQRGEGWVALQLLLLVCVVIACGVGPPWPGTARLVLLVVGIALIGAGAALAVAAVMRLGDSLSALPRPRDGAAIRTGGVYALVRHPIYGGLILITAGAAYATSPLALVPALLLAVVLDGKRRVEERFLDAHDPAYAAYRSRVRRALIPALW